MARLLQIEGRARRVIACSLLIFLCHSNKYLFVCEDKLIIHIYHYNNKLTPTDNFFSMPISNNFFRQKSKINNWFLNSASPSLKISNDLSLN